MSDGWEARVTRPEWGTKDDVKEAQSVANYKSGPEGKPYIVTI